MNEQKRKEKEWNERHTPFSGSLFDFPIAIANNEFRFVRFSFLCRIDSLFFPCCVCISCSGFFAVID